MNRQRIDTLIRALIAAIVIAITWFLTSDGADMAKEWEAVFVMVVAYYFKDRPQMELQKASEIRNQPLPNAAALELASQFFLAFALLAGTVFLFITDHPNGLRNSISGAWVGGATVAISFYFKNTGTSAESQHDLLRSVLAIGVALSTAVIYLVRHDVALASKGATAALPLQWIALAFIVITFYFKEKSTDSTTTNVQPATS
ncbi:MAG TPA: hypothetical protein VKB93_17325 [Thermoanaerobaculia bacterium]|nr:hypothetical protein [Thermoanaerobaculia bacterium]